MIGKTQVSNVKCGSAMANSQSELPVTHRENCLHKICSAQLDQFVLNQSTISKKSL